MRTFLHIIPNLGYGGAETFLLRLTKYIKGKHIILTLFNTKYDRNRINNSSITYITIDPTKISIKNIRKIIIFLINFDKVDIIFSWLYISDLLASLIKIIIPNNFKLVWNIRNTKINNNSYSILTRISYYLLRRFLLHIPDHIVFNSNISMQEHLKDGYPVDKSLVIYNGFEKITNLKVINLNLSKFHIAYVARYHPQKNHLLLFKSISYFKNYFSSNFELHLVGNDINSNNSQLINLLKDFDILENTKLYGVLDNKIVHSLFKAVDISLLLSSFGEGFPNVIAESMLYGTIPITTDVGDSSVIVSNLGTILPKDTNHKDIAREINYFLMIKSNDQNKWIEMKQKCELITSSRFTLLETAKKFESLL